MPCSDGATLVRSRAPNGRIRQRMRLAAPRNILLDARGLTGRRSHPAGEVPLGSSDAGTIPTNQSPPEFVPLGVPSGRLRNAGATCAPLRTTKKHGGTANAPRSPLPLRAGRGDESGRDALGDCGVPPRSGRPRQPSPAAWRGTPWCHAASFWYGKLPDWATTLGTSREQAPTHELLPTHELAKRTDLSWQPPAKTSSRQGRRRPRRMAAAA